MGRSTTIDLADTEDGRPVGRELDRQIATALQVEGRASWHRLAQLVGASEATVARRVKAMTAAGVLHSTVLADPQRCGFGFPVLIQFECEPNAAKNVAERLAERPDTRFVALVTGPFEVVAEVIVARTADLARILIDDIAAIPGITRTTTESVLRNFKMAYDWVRDPLHASSPAELVDVRAPVRPVTLDSVDLRMLDELRQDGRVSYQELAKRVGIGETAVRRRFQRLQDAGCVRPVTLVDPFFLGYDTEVFFWLKVAPRHFEDVAAALVGQAEVRYLSATSGFSDLTGEAIVRTLEDLYTFRTRVLGALEGVREIDVAVELRTLKRAHLRLDGGAPQEVNDGTD